MYWLLYDVIIYKIQMSKFTAYSTRNEYKFTTSVNLSNMSLAFREAGINIDY